MFVVPSPHVLYSPAKGEKEEPALQSPGQLLASAFPTLQQAGPSVPSLA